MSPLPTLLPWVLTASTAPVPMHGVGTQDDLVLPFPVTLAIAALVVVASFVVLGRRRVRPTEERPLPARAAALIDAPVAQWPLRVLGLVLTGWTMLAAWGGPDDALNPTALITYAVLWVGVIAVGSALLGPLYPQLDPVRTLWLLLCAALRREPEQGLLGRVPTALGHWPAAVVLLTFAWLELAAPDGDSTLVLRAFFLTMWLVAGVGTLAYGTSWLDTADGFTVASRLYGHLAPIGRRADGVIAARLPLRSAEAIPVRAGLAGVVVLLLAATLWDGLAERFPGLSPAGSTLGLLAVVLGLGGLYLVATDVAMRGARVDAGASLAARFAPSLVPIALGYVIAHYWTLLVIGTQQAIIRSSDPLGVGDDLIGTGDWGISYALVQPGLVATIKVTAVVLGHVAGVVVAHRIAARVLTPARWISAQVALLVVMVAITIAGLVLLFPE